MSRIRCVYGDTAPDFPATDQHPDAMRYGPITMADGAVVFVDAIGGEPTVAEIRSVLDPAPVPEPTPAEKLAAAGLTVQELKQLLGLT